MSKLPKLTLTPEQLEEVINSIPTHTKNCFTAMVGGYRLANDIASSPRLIWCCDEACPLKGKEL